MHKYEAVLLELLRSKGEMSLEEAVSQLGIGKDEVLWAVENLSKESMVEVKRGREHEVKLTEEGKRYASSMLPEERLLERLRTKSIKPSELTKEEQIGMQWCMKKGLAALSNGVLSITERGRKQPMPTAEGSALLSLSKNPEGYAKLLKGEKEALESLAKRKLIEVRERTRILSISITDRGLRAEAHRTPAGTIDAITREVIADRLWEKEKFKPYDVSLEVEREPMAKRHPLRQLMRNIREVYTSMGFAEISGPVIEPAFWVFDALFQPQDHPARDAQDTFYLDNPSSIGVEKDNYVETVGRAHKKSWKEPWKMDVAEKAVLRTHTTSVSARYINSFIKSTLKQGSAYEGAPIKRFTIGRVFRNENVDYKHLADFYQHDGIIIGKGLTLANLFSTLAEFYRKLDIEVKFKPSYFPFVEPGAEIFMKPRGSKQWMEIGGCGIIRREVTGVSRKSVSVLAWGCSLERLILAEGQIGSITELYNPGIGWLRSARML